MKRGLVVENIEEGKRQKWLIKEDRTWKGNVLGQKEITLNDTWTMGPLNKFNYDEKQILHNFMKEKL